VAVVGGSAILYSEVEQYKEQMLAERRERGYTLDRDPVNEALEALMLQKLLYTQGQIDSVDVNTAAVEQMVEENIAAEISARGGVLAVEQFYMKPVYDIKEEMKQRYTEMQFAQSMRGTVEDKVTITPGEVERFYRNLPKDSLPLVPEQYVYAQITKFPPSLKVAKERVRENLVELRERIMKGTSFSAMARMYSVDGSAARGGEMDPAPKEYFVTPFADALSKLKPGQVSEVVETEYGFHIIELLGKQGNLFHCRHILMRPVFTTDELQATVSALDSVANLVKEGTLTFEKAALDNSDDKFSKLNGGLVSNHEQLEMYGAMNAGLTSTRFPKEELPAGDFRTIEKMKQGELSAAFLTEDMRGNQLGKVIKLLEIVPSHAANIGEDYLALENLALQDKRQREFRKWLDSKIATMYVRIDPAFRSDEFENGNWLK
jgi:peptidyl-prolyl cis-trans isomerase SurA